MDIKIAVERLKKMGFNPDDKLSDLTLTQFLILMDFYVNETDSMERFIGTWEF